ncbi:macrophage mannose receptor 1 isoform X1 [Hydra vulgaris]|uniref:macrophage mannose receptor 1 isoform X1 n=1 Tax=Hydra vulgaris TaxID=6087 RepID=UPI0032EA3171
MNILTFSFSYLFSLFNNLLYIFSFNFQYVVSDTYLYQAPIYNVVIGECVELLAVTHFNHNGSEEITWKKDNKLLNDNKGAKSLSISSVSEQDAAYYQVKVHNKYLGVTEVTDIWLNVKGCQLYQKAIVKSSTRCGKLCIDICPKEWIYVPGTQAKCVQYFPQIKSWSDASESCQAIGGELAVIQNANENNFLGDILQTAAGAWIGLNDRSVESKYIWNFQSNKISEFFSWGEDEPNNYNKGCNIENCVQIKKETAKWIDLICGVFIPYVCQVDAVYNESVTWSCYRSKCYRYFNDLLVWEDALSRCKAIHLSGQLATIENQAENDLVAQLLIESAWIGLNDRWEAGLYSWSDNKQVLTKKSFFNWDVGEPNDKFYHSFANTCSGEDCVQLRKFGSKVTWHDLGCNTVIPHICEKIRDREITTGGLVGIIIGCLILFAVLGGLAHAAFQRHKKTAVKDIIKAAYQEDFLTQQKLSRKSI